ncbi:MAG TPA: MBL fold metallo-hydrolase [Terriglobia bacterium]|nr:MBL fold metallo-hydrolase [Terriglobia bacterium]
MRKILALVLLVAFGTGASAQQSAIPSKLVKVRDDLYMIENINATVADIGNYGGNITVYLTNDGVVLVDSKNEKTHDDVVAKVKSLTDKPIKYVVLTHNHGDHAGGAAKMQAIGATIIISASDRDNIARVPNAAWVPQFGYIGQAQLSMGGKEARLYELRGHTRGDTVVYFPAARVVTMGDLLTTSEDIPLIVNYPDGGSWMDWSKSIDEVLKLDFDIAIPGHGPMVTKQQLLNIRNKMVMVRERVRAMNRDKKTQQEITEALVKEFNWGMGPSAGNIPAMMQELR